MRAGTGSRKTCVPTALSRRIVRGLVAAGYPAPGGEDDYFIRRLSPGSGARSAGAWVWVLEAVTWGDGNHRTFASSVGSQWPARECAKDFAVELSPFGDLAIIPREFA